MPTLRFIALLSAILAFVISAHGAMATPQLLVDMRNGEVLFSEEAGRPWHPASLTKLMTAYVTFEAIAEGRVTLDTPVVISANALSAPPSKIGAPVDTAYRLEDALYMLIVKSANDIAIAIAETVSGSEAKFIAEMNEQARVQGLTATHYKNPHGLHDPEQVTSARDLAVLSLNIRYLYPQYADLFATGSVRLGQARLRSHNNLLTHFEGTTGMKTGYVCSAGLNIVATVQRQDRHLMAVVLGATSGRERGELAAQMLLQAFSGSLRGNGSIVTSIANQTGAPLDMRPFICGNQAKEYVGQRVAAFPMGLEGQPSYLTDDIVAPTYRASSLGRVRSVPMPRPRPAWAPAAKVTQAAIELVSSQPAVPLPRPRPSSRLELRAGL